MMLLTLVCANGGENEWTNDWERQDAEKLAAMYHCTCHGEPMKVQQVVNWTEKYSSGSVRVASFADPEERKEL